MALFTLLAGCLVGSALGFSAEEPLAPKFSAWKAEHGKSYQTIADEEKAFAAFTSNEAIINEHNARGFSWTLGHNAYSDMTWEEFSTTVMSELFLNRAPKNMLRLHLSGEEHAPLADSVDWVAKGAVTPVKDQKRCGSCWAFSATGSVEGALAVASGKLISLSEEELVQCSGSDGNQGCNGGLMDNAFEWIEKNPLCTESAYPYSSGAGQTGQCKKGVLHPNFCQGEISITSFRDVPVKNEAALKHAVAMQPVSVAIEADKSAFQLYKSGVLDSPSCGERMDHGVLIVGYGTDAPSGKQFWKVKNSWGSSWGEEGYLRIVQGKNMCGIANQASYPKGAHMVAPVPPSPTPPPTPPPPPSPPSHYEDPSGGCMSDEVEISIQGVSGDFCSPKCGFFKHCPHDVPEGVTAQPQCALKDAASGGKYCALICSPSLPILDQKAADDQCGENASCKSLQLGVGVCTYDD